VLTAEDSSGKLRRDSLLALASRVVGTGFGLGLTAFLARTLGAQEFGVYAWVVAATSLLEVPAALGFPAAVIRLVARYRVAGDDASARASSMFGLRTALVAGCVVSLLALAPLAAVASHQQRVASFAVLAAGLLLVPLGAYLAVLQGIFRAYQRIGLALVPPQVLAPALALVGAVAVSRLAPPLNAFAFLMVLLAVRGAIAIGQRLALRSDTEAAPAAAVSSAERRSWLGVGWQLTLVDTSSVFLRSTDIVLVGALTGPVEAGVYAIASRLAEFLSFGLLAVRLASSPAYAQLAASGDRVALQRLLRQGALWVVIPTTLAALVLVLVAEPVLHWARPEFVAARAPLAILAFNQWALAAFGPAGTLLSLSGHEREAARISLVSALANVGLNLVGISLLGGIGAAVATTASTFLISIWLQVAVSRRLGVDATLLALLKR
jgi:O-antigen/teichoic acid export membrane protein